MDIFFKKRGKHVRLSYLGMFTAANGETRCAKLLGPSRHMYGGIDQVERVATVAQGPFSPFFKKNIHARNLI
jgi:hypothetical protein